MPHGDEENRPAATKPAEPSSDPGTANTVDREGAGKPKRAGGRKRDPSRSAFRVEAGHLSCIYCSTKLSTNSAAERLRLHITVCQGNVPVELKKEVSEAETAGLERARKRAQSVLVKTDGGEDGKQPDSVRGARQADEKSRRKSTGNAKQQATTAAATDGFAPTSSEPKHDAPGLDLEEKRMMLELEYKQKLAEQKMQADLALSVLQNPNVPEELRDRALKVLDRHLPPA